MSYPDDFKHYGFLANDPDHTLASDYYLTAEIMERAREAVRLAIAELPKARNFTAQSGTAAALAFWLRTLESCQASILLCDRGMPGAAAATTRTAYECLFYCCALLKSPGLYSKLNEDHHFETKRQAKGLHRIKGLDLPEDVQRKLAEAAGDDTDCAKWSAFEAAAAAGLGHLYESVWRGMGALGAHATARSLERHVVSAPEGGARMTHLPDYRALEQMVDPVVTCLEIGRLRLREFLNSGAAEPPNPG